MFVLIGWFSKMWLSRKLQNQHKIFQNKTQNISVCDGEKMSDDFRGNSFEYVNINIEEPFIAAKSLQASFMTNFKSMVTFFLS